jgi:hypothetical protein
MARDLHAPVTGKVYSIRVGLVSLHRQRLGITSLVLGLMSWIVMRYMCSRLCAMMRV